MSRKISLILVIVFLLGRIPVFADGQEVVIFEDINLEEAVSESLGISVGRITERDMEDLIGLVAVNKDIFSLKGLEYAVNLEKLCLSYNKISDITALKNLYNLEHLWLDTNIISDISVLGNLLNLRTLELGDNNISDITELGRLYKLESLWLNINYIIDISVLEDLLDLDTLILSGNKISDITALENLNNLRTLHIDDNKIDLKIEPNFSVHNNFLTNIQNYGFEPQEVEYKPTPTPRIDVAYGQKFVFVINGETVIDKTILDQEYFEYEDFGVKTIVAKEIECMRVVGSDTVEVELTHDNPQQEVWFELGERVEIEDWENKEDIPLIPLEPEIPITPIEPSEPIEPNIPLIPLEPSKPAPTKPSKPTPPIRPSKPNVPTKAIEPVETYLVPPKISNIERENFISRWEHHREMGKDIIYHKEKEKVEIELSMNDNILISENGLQPRLYSWNTEKEKWVALATKINGKVESYNEVEGYIAVFAVKQPTFADVKGTEWYAEKLDRANGFAVVEGKTDKDKIILDAESNITRKELFAMVGRIFGAVEKGDTSLYNELEYITENQGNEWYTPYIETFKDKGIIEKVFTHEEANEEVTRLEVMQLLTKMLNRVETVEMVDLNNFTDTKGLEVQIANIVDGYSDNTLRLYDKITRIETITLLINTLEKLGW